MEEKERGRKKREVEGREWQNEERGRMKTEVE